jgi:hypothetical protein
VSGKTQPRPTQTKPKGYLGLNDRSDSTLRRNFLGCEHNAEVFGAEPNDRVIAERRPVKLRLRTAEDWNSKEGSKASLESAEIRRLDSPERDEQSWRTCMSIFAVLESHRLRRRRRQPIGELYRSIDLIIIWVLVGRSWMEELRIDK